MVLVRYWLGPKDREKICKVAFSVVGTVVVVMLVLVVMRYYIGQYSSVCISEGLSIHSGTRVPTRAWSETHSQVWYPGTREYEAHNQVLYSGTRQCAAHNQVLYSVTPRLYTLNTRLRIVVRRYNERRPRGRSFCMTGRLSESNSHDGPLFLFWWCCCAVVLLCW